MPAIGRGGAGGTYLRAEEPVDTIVRTRTYDLYITYDQVGPQLSCASHFDKGCFGLVMPGGAPVKGRTGTLSQLVGSTN